MRIIVTGATGRVGAEIAQFVDQKAHQVVLAMRRRPDDSIDFDTLRSKDLQQPEKFGADTVLFDFAQAATYEPALKGADSLFLMRPPGVSDVDKRLKQIVEVAIAANVRQIVFLSVTGAEKNLLLPHRGTEDYIKSKGIAYTFLRASFFMQNLSSVHRAEIKADREIFVPAGNGKTSFVDTRDVAAVAAKALTEPGHERRAYALTGQAALTYYQVADIFSEVLNHPVTYANPSLLRFVAKRLKEGNPLALTLVMSGLYTTAKLGLAGELSNDLTDILGRSPIPLRRFVEDYRSCWL